MRHLKTLLLVTAASAPLMAAAQSATDEIRAESVEQNLERLGEGDVLEGIKEQQQRDDVKSGAKEASKSLKSGLLSKLPSQENLMKLRALIEREPNNLDHYFNFASMAAALGEHASAAKAYETMLQKQPGLDRIKLDLAVSYMQLDQYEAAQRLLEDVLTRNPPETVKMNIETVLAKVGSELEVHEINGNIVIGFNLDTNGNSAPGDGQILILDTLATLGPQQDKEQDIQGFVNAGINHVYKPRDWRGEEINVRWNSSINAYSSEQSSLESLDIKLLALKTGPDITLPKQSLNIKPYVGHTVISLAGETYMRNTAGGADATWFASPRLQLNAGLKHEKRDFQNSDTVTTFADRSGTATQASIGARYMLTDKDMLNATATRRVERTRRVYHDNEQWQLNAGYTRILPMDSFAAFNTGFKHSMYDGNDPLISAKRRQDKEASIGVTLGTKINETLSGTMGYQFRNVDSNLPNYDYDNHRWSAALSARF